MPLFSSPPEFEDNAAQSGLIVKPLRGLKAFFNPYGAISANEANMAYRQLIADNAQNLVQHGLINNQDASLYDTNRNADSNYHARTLAQDTANIVPTAAQHTIAGVNTANTWNAQPLATQRMASGTGGISAPGLGQYDTTQANLIAGVPAARAAAENKQLGAEGSSADLISMDNAIKASPAYQNPYGVSMINQQKVNAGMSGQAVSDLPFSEDAAHSGAINASADGSVQTLPNGHTVQHTFNPATASIETRDLGLGFGATTEQKLTENLLAKQAGNNYGVPGFKPNVQRTHPLSVGSDGTLHHDGIPIKDVKDVKGTFADPAMPPKKMTLGQRLLKQITPTIASGNPQAFKDPKFHQYMNSVLEKKQQDMARINDLSEMLGNPPTKIDPLTGQRTSVYNHKQLEDMANELDKLNGE